ncbi:MAG: P27 family phage terminase small subunit [gamma proteobacterium symbiont of Taylorina sp.]|nr:P27 family phage terminase small subunit [gamma proteobacterium symbiont of Taylorina sp.]
METNNLYQLNLKPNLHNAVSDCKVTAKHRNLSERLKKGFKLIGYSEPVWDKFIPQALANNILDKKNIDTWCEHCAKELKPELKPLEGLIWDTLIAMAIEDGRFRKLHTDVWKEYCIVRSHMDKFRLELNGSTWTYSVDTRNGKQQKSKPEVAQLNESIRQWHWLVAQLGLGVKSEKELEAIGAIHQQLTLGFDNLEDFV